MYACICMCICMYVHACLCMCRNAPVYVHVTARRQHGLSFLSIVHLGFRDKISPWHRIHQTG